GVARGGRPRRRAVHLSHAASRQPPRVRPGPGDAPVRRHSRLLRAARPRADQEHPQTGGVAGRRPGAGVGAPRLEPAPPGPAGGPTRLRGRRGIGGGALAVFVTACLAVLALTFLLAVLVGRQWAHRTSTADSARVTGAPASSGARSRARRLSEREAEEPASQI